MKWEKLLTHLESTDEGKAFKSELASHIEEFDKLGTDLSTASGKIASLGDRDVGELVALGDWLKENGLDTPEKLSEYKNNAEGLKLSNDELKASAEKLKTELEQGSQKIKNDADNVMLKANVKVALADRVGDKGGFNLVIDNLMNNGLFSADETGELLYGKEGQRKKLTESLEELRTAHPFAFSEKPQGTQQPPKPSTPATGDQNTQNKSSFADVVNEMN